MAGHNDKDLFHITPDGFAYTDGAPEGAPAPANQTEEAEYYTPWYHRRSVIIALAATVAAGAAVTTAYNVIKSGNEITAAADSPDVRTAPAGWAEKMAKANVAREALTSRYESCEITNITDTQTSQKTNLTVPDYRGFPGPAERTERNEVHMTVRAVKTPAAMQAEKDYADGTPDAKMVQWYPFSLGASTDIIKKQKTDGELIRVYIPRTSKAKTSGANGEVETFSVTMYPRTDKNRTTSANVSLYTHLETYDPYRGENGTTYEAMGRITCGNISETVVDGKRQWRDDPKPQNPVPPKDAAFQACEFAADACTPLRR